MRRGTYRRCPSQPASRGAPSPSPSPHSRWQDRRDGAARSGRDLDAAHAFNRADDVQHAAASAGTKVHRLDSLVLQRVMQRRNMTLGEIDNMDIVAHAGAVRRRVVVAKDGQLRQDARRDLHDIGHEVVGNAVRGFADEAALVRADGVKVAQQHDRQLIVSLRSIAQDLLDHVLRPAVGVGAVAGGCVLLEGHILARAVNRRRGAKDQAMHAVLFHDLEQRQRRIEVVAVVRDRLLHRLADRLQPRRKHACELAGLTTMPVIVRDIDRDAATIIMVDSNLQRENILPSERAKAYKMKMEAIKRQGARTDLTSPKISAKFRSDDEVGQDAGVSGDTIRNYIALTQLVPELQQMVDEKKIALSPAYQLAALTPKEQGLLLETIDSEQTTPSLSQAQRMKKLSQSGELNEDTMLSIMMEQKKPEKNDITLSGEKLRKYFPRSYTPFQIENTIFKLLDAWQKKRQRDQSR